MVLCSFLNPFFFNFNQLAAAKKNYSKKEDPNKIFDGKEKDAKS